MCNGKDVFFHSVRFARDIMTKDIKMLTLDETVETCDKFMKDNKVRHVCVIDPPTEEGEKAVFVGVVSGRDIDRQLSPYVGKIGEEDTDQKALRQPLSQIVTRQPKSASPETPISHMIATMVDNHVDMIPVLADGELVGIVTVSDIIKIFVRLNTIRQLCANVEKQQKRPRLADLASGSSLDLMALISSAVQTVEDSMTEQVICLEKEDSLGKAVEVIQKRNFRHLPIVDEQRRFVGIVSDRDILRHLPFAKREPASQTEVFRGDLFGVSSKDPSLKLRITKVMTRDVVSVLPSCSFNDAVKTLHDKRVSCLPVVDEEKKILGIVTVSDVLRTMLAAYQLTERTQANPELAANAGHLPEEKELTRAKSV
jgi:acetoin utilization protein AcuB